MRKKKRTFEELLRLKQEAEDPHTSVPRLIVLSKHEDEWIREAVASNPNTPVEILLHLSKDPYAKKGLTHNYSLPAEIRLNLFKGSGEVEPGQTGPSSGD